jgi:shikimate dehydrogenase
VSTRRGVAPWPSAATSVVGVIGSPVGHSLSPAVHNAAFATLDLDWAFLAFEVPSGGAREAIAGARALGVRGLAVTMPHKAAAADAADVLDPLVRRLGAANTLVLDGGRMRATSTDGAGFLAGLRETRVDVAGARCAVVGAGGAARAVVVALVEAGAGRVDVWARRPAPAEEAVSLAGVPAAMAGGPEVAADARIVVNATPLGMAGAGEGELPFDPGLVGPGQLVVDLVYRPAETALLAAARSRGAEVLNGLPMLVHQAALQFELWTGRPAPIAAMREAAGAAGDQELAAGRGR